MKKALLTITSIVGSVLISQAQITVSSSDVVGIGAIVTEAEDTTSTFNVGSAGANQTWDFSAVLQHVIDTSTFLIPSTAPGSQSFPTATMVMNSMEDDSTYIFIEKTTSILKVVGVASFAPNGDTVTTDFKVDILTFPSTMGTTFSSGGFLIAFEDTVNFDPDGPGPHAFVDSIRMTRSSSVSSEIDGWGNVITPLGTFAVLRQDVREINTDTLWMQTGGTWTLFSSILSGLFGMDSVMIDTNYTMNWWSDDANIAFPLVDMEYDAITGDNTGGVGWLLENPSVGIGSNSFDSEIGIFPNPNNGQFVLTYLSNGTTDAQLNIYDSFGKLIISELIEERINTIDLNNAASGIYLIQVNDGNTILTRKIVVQ